MIHVVLLTCERAEYTARTLETFLQHNAEFLDVSTLADWNRTLKAGKIDGRFKLWHCDDASQDRRVRRLAGEAGFDPLIYTDQRVGVTDMIRTASRRLEHQGAEWMLLLENDWETVRAFPWAVFDAIQSRGDVWAMRLYGRFKERHEQRPSGGRHRGRDGADPGWEQFEVAGEQYEVGHIHWGNPPTVAKVERVAWLHKKAKREKDAIALSGQITERVARVVSNVVYHIGIDRTPGFVS